MERSFESFLKMLEVAVRDINFISAQRLEHDAAGVIQNALATVKPSDRVHQLTNSLTSDIHELAKRGSQLVPGDLSTEKKKVMGRIEELRRELQKCETSAVWDALGLS